MTINKVDLIIVNNNTYKPRTCVGMVNGDSLHRVTNSSNGVKFESVARLQSKVSLKYPALNQSLICDAVNGPE